MNYPNKKEHTNKTYIEYGKRGMTLESDINSSNNYYLENDIAVIHKKPTPTKVIKLIGNRIKDGFYEIPSTTDYNGIYKGKYIDFEAKETISKKGFLMSNIAKHQLDSMQAIINQKGITFAIVFLKSFNEIYLIDGQYLIDAYNSNKTIIPYEEIKNIGCLIKEGYFAPVDYIKVVKEKYFEK